VDAAVDIAGLHDVAQPRLTADRVDECSSLPFRQISPVISYQANTA